MAKVVVLYYGLSDKAMSHMCYATPTINPYGKIPVKSVMCFSLPCNMGTTHSYSTHGDHPSLLYTWGPSIPIVHMGTIHPYCTHGDHPSLLYTWGPSIPIVHMGTIHPYCTDHPSLLYTWGPSIPIVHMGKVVRSG